MQVVDEFEGYYWQGGSIVRKCMWGWSCETGGKIKIPLWPAVNLRLLTAQRSCCVTGFLMTLQQPFATNGFELIYFSFYKHPTPLPPPRHLRNPPSAAPPSSSRHRHPTIQFLSPSSSPSAIKDTHIYCVPMGCCPLFSTMPVAGNICL